MIRTILSPGVELKETDKSQYTPDIGTTPRALIMGFAPKGPVQTTTEVTSMADFRRIYGTPKNEVERYFYNGAEQLVAAGATVVASKIPYVGDDNFVGVQYKIKSRTDAESIKDVDVDLDNYIELFSRGEEDAQRLDNYEKLHISRSKEYATNNQLVANILNETDNSITNILPIVVDTARVYSNKEFRSLEAGDRNYTRTSGSNIELVPDDSFVIVDKTKGIYDTFTGNGSNVDCLGILPVVTTAANAMAIASEISSINMDSTVESEISAVNLFESLENIDYIKLVKTAVDNAVESSWTTTDDEISSCWSVGPNTKANTSTLNSISKIAAQYFPPISYSSNSNVDVTKSATLPFDHTYFSHIGIVVFRISVDRGSGCLEAVPIEAFAGSLMREAKDLRTNASAFIEDIVNSTSDYISIYVSDTIADQEIVPVQDAKAKTQFTKNTILYAEPTTGIILGIPTQAVKDKKIKYSDITEYMENVFKAQSNILGTTLDVVVDAGISTIGECVKGSGEDGVVVSKLDILKQDKDGKNQPEKTGGWTGWRTIISLFKKFCETTRKDCVFICDSPRFLTLKNQRKLVNPYDMSTSVADTILPRIKYISGINTSYGWGYVPWFKIGDAATGTAFWCPPSVFGANRYITTRTRWHTWDAPAGMTRGAISIDDTSFEPDLNARNVIYSNGWNYALTDVQNGVTTLEGQKTFQSYTSAFDRINVRSLFLDLERRVFKIARNYVYEPNTADTRQQFVDNIDPIFASTKAEGGCYDYRIICDESINTPQVIDNNELRVRIGVQPVKTIEFILIEFVASRTGSNWSELVATDA